MVGGGSTGGAVVGGKGCEDLTLKPETTPGATGGAVAGTGGAVAVPGVVAGTAMTTVPAMMISSLLPAIGIYNIK